MKLIKNVQKPAANGRLLCIKKRRITLYSSRIILIMYENYLHDKT